MMTTLGLRVKMTGERLAHFSGRKRVGIRLRVSAVAVSEGTMRGETVRRRRPDETRDRHARVHTACARIRLACVSARAHCTIILFSIIVMIIILLYYILLSGQLLGERALRATRTGDYPDGTVGPENKKKQETNLYRRRIREHKRRYTIIIYNRGVSVSLAGRGSVVYHVRRFFTIVRNGTAVLL